MSRFVLMSTVQLCALLLATVAHAQTAAPTAQTETSAEVVVTGSRIARRDFQSVSPIATVGVETLKQTNVVNVEGVLNQLPQFVQGQGQSAIGAVANGGRATLNLRGLGETRNLVLLDGRRLPLSSPFGVVDVNIIPTNILEGVETITGGASAVYGSDAMSGVVNFKTLRHFNGLQMDVRHGGSFEGGAGTNDVSIAGGVTSADDKGSALLSLSYSQRDVLWGHERADFFSQGVLSSFIGQGTFVPSATNLPTQAAVNTAFAAYGVAAGTIPNSRSLGFNDDGTLFSQIGTQNYKGPSTVFYSTTGATVRQPVAMQEYVIQPMERWNLFGKFEYELSDSVTAYAQVLSTKSTVTGQVGYSPTLFVVPTIPVTNPFIPAALRPILASRPTAGADFTLNERFVAFEDRKFVDKTNVSQFLVGAKGDVGYSDWRWDLYASHDSMDFSETQDKALLLSRMSKLLYAADGGASICAGGFNPFGLANQSSVSASCRDYIQTKTHDVTTTSQDIIEGNLTGSLLKVPAGDVRFSLTGTHRENDFTFDPDNARESSDIIGTLLTSPSQGATSVNEAAVELLVPLLREQPFANSLDVTLGYRYSDYDISGSFSTYKGDVAWKPISSLLFRGGYERAIRTPNIGELFSSAQAAQAQIGSPPGAGDPCDVRTAARTGGSAAQLRALCVATGVPASIVDTFQYTTVAVGAVASGSLALTPETADTYTLGAVWRSEADNPWLSGISLSVDYYDIAVQNVISQVSGPTTINKCYNLDGSNTSFDAANIYCRLITRDATGGVSSVSTPYLNLGGLKTRGVDVQADWKIALDEVGLGAGALSLNALVNFTNAYEVQLQQGSPFVDYADTIDGTQAATTPPVGLPLPKYKAFLNLGYAIGPADIGLRMRYLPKMRDVTAVTRPASPAAGVPSYQLYDLNAGWKFESNLAIRGGINNLFDEAPVMIAGTPGLTQPGTYDIVGRAYYVSVSKRF